MYKKLLQLKTLLVALLVMTGAGNVWAQSTSTLTFSAKCNGSGTAENGVSWTVTSDGSESNFDNSKGIHYGTSSLEVQYIKLSTSQIVGTITRVVVNASTASGVSATVDVTVGGVAFGGDPQSLSTSANNYTFNGSASGEIVVTVTKPSKATKALYVKSVAVTYTSGGTSNLTDNDLALTGAPVELSFDLYDNAAPQVISYTTSSTGDISVGNNDYATFVVDQANKTITVTPVKVTPSDQTITVSQAADGTYAAGTKTFTVNITDSTPLSGGDVTFTCGIETSTELSITKNGVTLSTASGTWSRTDNYRVYANNSLTVSTTSGKITKIQFTISQNNFSGDGYNATTNTWTGSSESVTLAAYGGQVRFKSVVVTITSADAVAKPVISGPASFLENTEVTIAAEEDATIYYTTDGNDPTTSSTQYTVPFTLSATTTVKAIAVKDGKNSAIAEVAFTKVIPMTVAQAIEATPASGNLDNVYVRGIVSAFYDDAAGVAEDQYHRYYISDDGTSTNQLLVFNGKGLNNVAFNSDDDLRIGDQVVITGQLTTYKDTKEFAKDNYIISLITKANPEISYSQTEYNVTLGGSFEAPSLANPNKLAVTYSISGDEGVASVDELTGAVTLGSEEGTVTITASFAGNETYRAGSASYTLTVKDLTKGTETNPYTVADVIAGKANGRSEIYVIGYIVGEFNSKTQNPRTSGFTTDANIALADEFTTSPTAAASIPVALPTDALKATWGCKTSNGSTIGTKVLVKGNGEPYFTVEGIKNTTSVVAIVAPASIILNAAGYATFASTSAVDFSETEGYSAWAVTSVNGSEITFSQITNAVAAGTGVLLKGVASAEINPVYVASGNAVEGNKLEGVTVAKAVAENEYYGLSGNKFVKVNPGTVKAGKALLPVSALGSSSSVRTFTFVFVDPTTGISETQTVSAEQFGEVFNLAGQRIGQPQKGVNIINGKKVLVK